MNNLILSILLLFFFSLAADAAEVCGHVTHPSKNSQLIPVQGRVKTELKNDEIVSCGSMIITHEDAVWIELSDLTLFKIAPDSFFEVSKKDSAQHLLYRGEVLVTAPPSIRAFELTTPNSVSVFQGGVMLVRYTPKAKETTMAVFNRKVSFKNKFHTEAEQVVAAGEMSRLWIGESRIIPTEPVMMNPTTVKTAVQGFAVTPEETAEMIAVVERAVESRSKSLVADLEGWEEIEKQTDASAERSIASVGKNKKTDTSIDLKEAAIGLQQLKKHLYGDEQDQKMFDDSRKPASIHTENFSAKLQDREYQHKKVLESHQVKKVIEDIRGFDPEND